MISKTCNPKEMGAQAFSSLKSNFDGKMCRIYPPNIVEAAMTITIVRAGEAPELLAGLANLENVISGEDKKETLSQVISAQLNSAGLGVELGQWRDSNHESMFFNNDTGAVSFLSLDPEILRQNMHPVLLKHLINNGINVGEDLMTLSDKHWSILSTLTDVRRTKEEVAQVNTCLCSHVFQFERVYFC